MFMSTHVIDTFRFCPSCGQPAKQPGANPFTCVGCDYIYYFNPSITVGGIVADHNGRILLLRRAHNPGKGKFGLPGGFVEPGESTEDALIREVKEEINLQVQSLEYITSLPNTYAYRGVTLPISDVFYTCHVDSFESLQAHPDEVEGYLFCHPTEKELGQMAFASNRRAIELYLRRTGRACDRPAVA